MNIYWETIFFICAVIKLTLQSIAGVTYMDDFDFEERYRDVNECNPFYWYPLNLPEKCQGMFEKLIRSQLAHDRSLRNMVERDERSDPIYKYSYYPEVYPPFETMITFNSYPKRSAQKSSWTPYEKMLNMIKNDIKYFPTLPKISSMPYLGTVAIYRQPISKQSEIMIKKMSRMYAEAGLAYNAMPVIYKKKKNRKNKQGDSSTKLHDNENNFTTSSVLKHKENIKIKKRKDGTILTIINRRT